MQIDPIKPTLKAPATERLKLKHYELLSNVAFKFNLRRYIQDIILVGCMGPPGGGRNPVSNRLLRHFNFLSFTDMSDESCVRIFDTILGRASQTSPATSSMTL